MPFIGEERNAGSYVSIQDWSLHHLLGDSIKLQLLSLVMECLVYQTYNLMTNCSLLSTWNLEITANKKLLLADANHQNNWDVVEVVTFPAGLRWKMRLSLVTIAGTSRSNPTFHIIF